jgi:hypothetical protein
MRRLVFSALVVLLAAACEPTTYDAGSTWDTGAGYVSTEFFARGQTFEDQSTFWGDTNGFALGDDHLGVLGMVGMVCSFGTADGGLRVDVDSDEGDELVVGAVNAAGGGVISLAVDGAQLTISEFPSEWEGAVTVDVVLPGSPVEAASLAAGTVLVARTVDQACRVERLDATARATLASWSLEGACASAMTTDGTTGTGWISTAVATWQLPPSGEAIRLAGPSAHLSWANGRLARGTQDGTLTVLSGAEPTATLALEGTLVGLEWISGDRLVAALTDVGASTLVVLDAELSPIERVPTTAPISALKASPQGGVIAARGPMAVHVVRVVP